MAASPPVSYRFPRHERLKSRQRLEAVYADGKQLAHKGLRVRFLVHPQTNKPEHANGQLIQLALSVPKRKHKRATTRNTLKRRLREAYRLNNHALKAALESEGAYLECMLFYDRRDVAAYATLARHLTALFQRMIGALGHQELGLKPASRAEEKPAPAGN